MYHVARSCMASTHQRESVVGPVGPVEPGKQKKKISLQEWELIKQQRLLQRSLRQSKLVVILSERCILDVVLQILPLSMMYFDKGI